MLVVDLLRHGALEGGVKYRGSIEGVLTLQGEAAMDKVWADVSADTNVIISSPLLRCATPARRWAEQWDIDLRIDARIQELHYGLWEGKTVDEIAIDYPEILRQWRENPEHMTPPQGESMQNFLQRTTAFLASLPTAYDHQHVLIVGHSGSIRALIAHALQAPCVSTRHLQMPYACWSRIVYEHGRWSLSFHNREVGV